MTHEAVSPEHTGKSWCHVSSHLLKHVPHIILCPCILPSPPLPTLQPHFLHNAVCPCILPSQTYPPTLHFVQSSHLKDIPHISVCTCVLPFSQTFHPHCSLSMCPFISPHIAACLSVKCPLTTPAMPLSALTTGWKHLYIYKQVGTRWVTWSILNRPPSLPLELFLEPNIS